MQPDGHIQVSSTGPLPVADRFPYWADVVTQTFVPLECDTPDKSDFIGTIRYRKIGRIGIADVCASAQRARRTPAMIAKAPSDDLIVTLHLDGRCRVLQNVNAAELRPGDGAMVGTDESYAFEFPRSFRQLVLKMPASALGEACARRKQIFLLGIAPAKLLRRLALSVLDDLAYVSNEEELGIERAFAELLRSAALPERLSIRDATNASLRYATALSFIEQRLSDPTLNPAAVARHLGISSRSLARVFAQHGATVERTIWRARLDAAKRDLSNPRASAHSITQIAFAWAFNDAAHFSRSFSRTYGMTPKHFRALSSRRF